jgi:photosystem II stability/assembly factor-like uncharacterized protein
MGLEERDINALVLVSLDPNILFAGTTSGGVFKITDGETTWHAISKGITEETVFTIALHPTNQDILYAGTSNGGIFKTTDGGKKWVAMKEGLPNSDVFSLAIDPQRPWIIYAGTSAPYMLRKGRGIFKSMDAGETWQPIPQDLTDAAVFTIVIDSANSNLLYAGTDGEGIFKSGNGGQKWSLGNRGLVSKTIFALRVDPMNSRILYAGTGKGVWTTEPLGRWQATASPMTIYLHWLLTLKTQIFSMQEPGEMVFIKLEMED